MAHTSLYRIEYINSKSTLLQGKKHASESFGWTNINILRKMTNTTKIPKLHFSHHFSTTPVPTHITTCVDIELQSILNLPQQGVKIK